MTSALSSADGVRDDTTNPKCDSRTKNMAPPLATSTNRNRDRDTAPEAGILLLGQHRLFSDMQETDAGPRQLWGPEALLASREARRLHQEQRAATRDRWVHAHRYYYDRFKRVLRFI